MNRFIVVSIMLIAAALCGPLGCLERKERITVEPDGRVLLHVEYVTESYDEMHAGDAVPSLAGGWLAVETVQKQEDGDEKFRLVADIACPPGTPLPSNYAAPPDARPLIALQFPSALTIEPRADGTYFHFCRRYEARAWASVRRAYDMVKEELESLAEHDFMELTGEQRHRLIELLATVEIMKHLAYARAAFKEALDSAPQDASLAVRTAVIGTLHDIDYNHIIDLLSTEDRDIDDEAINHEAMAFDKSIRTAMTAALREQPGISESKIREFLQRFDWHRSYDEISEDLQDDSFEIEVQMPGEIVAHNADRMNDNVVEWEFTGEMLRDNAVELMVTSRLPR